MSDTQKPAWWLNTTQGFDFTTITGQTPENSPDIDLSEPIVNHTLVNLLNTEAPGRTRSFLNGIISQDDTDGFFYLTGDATKTDSITITQSQDDITAGYNITMDLQGDKTDEQITDNLHTNKSIDHVGVTQHGDAEAQAITQSFNTHNHNKYAYTPMDHPEHQLVNHFQSGEYVTAITQGSGVYTTRIMDHYQWNFPTHTQRTSHSMSRIDGAGNNKVMKADGVTVDPIATFYNQQSSISSGSSWHTDPDKPEHYFMSGMHFALSMSVKLGSGIAEGEFVPVVMIDRPSWGRAIPGQEWTQDREDSSRWRDIRKRVAAMTGTEPDNNDWWKHMTQYHFLTSDALHQHKRNIKHMVIYIGKPIGGNQHGGVYEMVVWLAGLQEVTQSHGTGDRIHNNTPGGINNPTNTSHLPKCYRVPVDHPDHNDFDPSAWNPLFYHSVGSNAHSYKVGQSTWLNGHYHGETSYRTGAGMGLAAFGPGVMDLAPGNLNMTELHSDLSRRESYQIYNDTTKHPVTSYESQAPNLGWGFRQGGYYMTFLAIPGKIQGVANINQHVYDDAFQVPEQSGDESNKKNLTYFPQHTVQYETIGAGCEIVSSSDGWKDVDFILDGDLTTHATATKLGSDNDIQIKLKPAAGALASQITGSSVLKQLNITIRGVTKRYMNPGLKFNYSLWNYLDPDNPQQVSPVGVIQPQGTSGDDDTMALRLNMNGNPITYDDLNNCRLRIWISG